MEYNIRNILCGSCEITEWSFNWKPRLSLYSSTFYINLFCVSTMKSLMTKAC